MRPLDQTLVDRIYECAFAPERWPGVLEEVARLANARGGVFVTANSLGGVLRWAASDALAEDVQAYIGENWLKRDMRAARVMHAKHQGFLTERELFTPEEYETDRARREFYVPRGLGWVTDTAEPLPTGDWFIFNFPREIARGPVEPEIIARLDALRPHLARASLLSARLQMEQARVASETLALIGLPALVFSAEGKVLAANAAIQNLPDYIRWRASDRMSLCDLEADMQLRRAVTTISADSHATVRSFALRGKDGAAAMVAHVIPVRGAAKDIFAMCSSVMTLTPVTAPHAPPIELIRSLFDLTPSEARVARHLATGETLDEIAAGAGVTRNTVRAQLRSVLEKTGCRRQAEIVVLLGGVALPGGASGEPA